MWKYSFGDSASNWVKVNRDNASNWVKVNRDNASKCGTVTWIQRLTLRHSLADRASVKILRASNSSWVTVT
jgi:hypothetical protein